MKKLAALLAVLIATACGTQKLDPAAIHAAMPDASAVKIDQPEPSPAATRLAASGIDLSVATPAAAGDPSPYAVISYFFATSVNAGVGGTLLLLEYITLWPPTSCTDAACTWGPGAGQGDVNRFMMVVTKNGDGYDYALSAQPLSNPAAPFTTLISGTAFPGPTRPQGHGTLVADFDAAWANLDHRAGEVQTDFGRLEASYDGREAMKIGVTFLGTKSDKPSADPAVPFRTNAVYAFQAAADGGELQVGFRTVEPYATGFEERVGLRTRWNAAGEGRADVSYDAFSDPTVSYDGSQCWAGAAGNWAMTYDFTLGIEVGSQSSCAFTPALPFGLTIP